MIGSIKFNIVFGLVGLLLVSLLSFNLALLVDSIIKALIAFVLFYMFAYIVRWLLFLVFSDQHLHFAETSEGQMNVKRESLVDDEGMLIIDRKEQEPLNNEEIEKTALLVKDLLKKINSQ